MANSNDKIRVWDIPVRLFHWALVILITTSYFSGRAGGDWMQLHFYSGYSILTLLLFRIAWGFVGSTTARFSHFVKGPVHDSRVAVLNADGVLIHGGRPVDVDRVGLPTNEYVAVPVQQGSQVIGHFLLTAASHVAYPSREQRRVAVLLADQVAAVDVVR